MAVMVTGGLGVIGSWVTRKLVEQGITTVTYSRNLYTSLIKDIIQDVNCVTGDILDLPNLIRTIKHNKIERIIHMAALLIPPLEANPFMGYRFNVEGSMNILEAARIMDIKRVVYASSQAVYDKARGEYAHPTYTPIDENYPKAPQTVYGATKLFIENMGLNYNRIYGLDFLALRFGFTYGPGKQARHGVVGIHSKIIESAMIGEYLNISQGGDQIFDMVYHKDVALGVVLACFAEKTEHRIFNISTGKGETLQHLIEILDEYYDGVPIKIGPGLNPLEISDLNYLVLSINRAKEELGFSPQYDLNTAVKDYIETMKRLNISPSVLL